jgi:4,4'-diaponeurosporenoate glycosyltransferase
LEILTYSLIIITCLFYLSGYYFLYRIPVCKLNPEIVNYPRVAIIIPARNEETNIGTLLDSINGQAFHPAEVIVVNDFSKDNTKMISFEKGANVIDSQQLPDGWLGKPWACWQGAQASSSDLFIFLDSDIELEKDGLKMIVDTYLESSHDKNIAMSVAPYHKIVKLYEELSAIFNIIMNGSMNAFTPSKKPKPTGLFGQSLIVNRDNYYRINGHESVRNRILENMFMAEKFLDAGISLKCFGGFGSLSFRMYPDGLKNLINGWSKAFASGAGQIPTLTLLNIILWIASGFIITIFFVLSLFGNSPSYIWPALYGQFTVQMFWMQSRIGSFRMLTSFLFPLHLLFFSVVFTRSLIFKLFNKKIQWKSREVSS